jgi:hypothetical protein
VVISADPELARLVHRSGKAHSDAILVGNAGPSPILEPVDFKWTLETAVERQVGADVLRGLLEHPSEELARRLAQAIELAGCEPGLQPHLLPGRFLAPDSPANRAVLASGNSIAPQMVDLRPVDVQAFFATLPGWELALELARADTAPVSDLESAERYYRLGAGVLGALRRLRTSIFAEQPLELEGRAELAALRARRRLHTTGELVAYLDRALRERAALAMQLERFERSAYPFTAFRRLVEEHGLAAGSKRAGRVYGEVLQAVRAEARREGRQLVAAGRSDEQALQALAPSTPQLEQLAHQVARRLVGRGMSGSVEVT